MFKLNWVNVKSALVYGFMWGFLAVLITIKEVGDIRNLIWIDLVNVFIMAGLGFIIPLIKNFFTNDAGKFAGIVTVIPNKE